MEEMLKVTNSHGIPFNVRLVLPGERYGLDDCLMNTTNQTMIEFFDSRFTQGFGPRGQFVGRWYLSNIMELTDGLCLYGGVKEWEVTKQNIDSIRNWVTYIALKKLYNN